MNVTIVKLSDGTRIHYDDVVDVVNDELLSFLVIHPNKRNRYSRMFYDYFVERERDDQKGDQ